MDPYSRRCWRSYLSSFIDPCWIWKRNKLMVSCLPIYHFLAMDSHFVFYVVWTHHGWIFIRVHLQSLPEYSCPILLCNRMAQNIMRPVLRRRYKLYNRITPFSVLFLRRQISYSWTVLSSCNHIHHFHICYWHTSNI